MNSDLGNRHEDETARRKNRKSRFRRLIFIAAAGLVVALPMGCVTHIHNQTYGAKTLNLEEEGLNFQLNVRSTRVDTHKHGPPFRLRLKWGVNPDLIDELYCDKVSILWPDGNRIDPLIHTATLYQKGPKGIPAELARENARKTLGEEFAPPKFTPGDTMVVEVNLRIVRDGLRTLRQVSFTMTAKEHCWIGILIGDTPGLDITFYTKTEPKRHP